MLGENRMTTSQPPTDLALILAAAMFAAERHRHQRRKDAEASPFINHPLTLADILVNEGGVHDASVIAAALLHDTVEDTNTSNKELVEHFGQQIAGIVAEVTDNKSLAKQERKRLQIVHARTASHEARLVKLADKIANLRDLAARPPHDWPQERRAEYVRWSVQVVDELRGTHEALEAAFDVEVAAATH